MQSGTDIQTVSPLSIQYLLSKDLLLLLLSYNDIVELARLCMVNRELNNLITNSMVCKIDISRRFDCVGALFGKYIDIRDIINTLGPSQKQINDLKSNKWVWCNLFNCRPSKIQIKQLKHKMQDEVNNVIAKQGA